MALVAALPTTKIRVLKCARPIHTQLPASRAALFVRANTGTALLRKMGGLDLLPPSKTVQRPRCSRPHTAVVMALAVLLLCGGAYYHASGQTDRRQLLASAISDEQRLPSTQKEETVESVTESSPSPSPRSRCCPSAAEGSRVLHGQSA